MHWYGWVLIGLLVVSESYYWFVYFPRAYRDGSNHEIRDIRTYVEYLKAKYSLGSSGED